EEGDIMEHKPREEGMSNLQDWGENFVVKAHLLDDNVDVMLAGIFKTTINKKQVDGVHDFDENHGDAPCMCQKNMDGVKVERAPLVEYEESK
ncbi:hypothetical protein KI387_002944, partial [Taxus chinensis]